MLRVAPHSPPLGSTNRTRSELDGSFSVRVYGKPESVLAIVSPPGHVLQAFEVPVRGEPVVLNVSPDGGTLEVDDGVWAGNPRQAASGERDGRVVVGVKEC